MTREEAIEWMGRIKDRYIHGGDEGFDNKRKEAIGMAVEALKQPDTMTAVLFDGVSGNHKIGLEPVKHGHWEEEQNGNGWNDYWDYTCSVCGKKYKNADDILYEANFCPNCGAKMDEDGKDEK